MKTLCVLCLNANIDAARANTTKLWPNVSTKHTFLNTPLSTDGQLPATHWFCMINVPDEKVQEYLDMQKVTTIEETEKELFLAKYNLEVIKQKDDQKG